MVGGCPHVRKKVNRSARGRKEEERKRKEKKRKKNRKNLKKFFKKIEEKSGNYFGTRGACWKLENGILGMKWQLRRQRRCGRLASFLLEIS